MAEGKHSGSKNFGKVLQKTVFRTKEKVLQNLGKADKTQDDEFDSHVVNFKLQETTATKLQKDLKNYLICVKAMSVASSTFYETLRETYEDSWTGHSEMTGATEALSAIWEDYLLKLTNQVQDPVTAYVTRFPDMKQRVSKRNRKLMDYDGTRHTLESVSSQKKRDEAKVQKATEDMQASKRIYDEINTELHQDLPSLYENRKSVLSNVLNSLFSCEGKFQEESAKIKNSLSDATERLNRECSDVFFKQYNSTNSPHASVTRGRGSTSSSTPTSDNKLKLHPNIPNNSSDRSSNRSNSVRSSRQGSTGGDVSASPASLRHETERRDSGRLHPSVTTNGDVMTPASPARSVSASEDGAYENVMMESQTTILNEESADKISKMAAADDDDITVTQRSHVDPTNNNESKDNSDQSDTEEAGPGEGVYSMATEDEDTYSIPTNNQPVQGLPGGVLYQVQATHPYTGDDTDELTFEIGDLINVVEFDDPEDQDDGWLMGIKIVSGEKGVFPENFTKKL